MYFSAKQDRVIIILIISNPLHLLTVRQRKYSSLPGDNIFSHFHEPVSERKVLKIILILLFL